MNIFTEGTIAQLRKKEIDEFDYKKYRPAYRKQELENVQNDIEKSLETYSRKVYTQGHEEPFQILKDLQKRIGDFANEHREEGMLNTAEWMEFGRLFDRLSEKFSVHLKRPKAVSTIGELKASLQICVEDPAKQTRRRRNQFETGSDDIID